MKRMLGYIADFSEKGKILLKDQILYVDKKEPLTPYFLLKIQVLKYEPNFSHQRSTLNIFRRIFKAFKEANKVFKSIIKTG